MSEYIIKYVLVAGASGAVASGLALALKPLIKKAFGCAWMYRLLIFAAAMFVLPVGFAARAFNKVSGVDVLNFNSAGGMAGYMAQPFINAAGVFAENVGGAVRADVFNIFSIIWVVGFLAFILRYVRGYLAFQNRTVEDNTPVLDEDLAVLLSISRKEKAVWQNMQERRRERRGGLFL